MELVDAARRVDIAVAWVSPCDEVEALAAAASRGKEIRAVVGTSGNSTCPCTLRRLSKFADLRIPPNDSFGIFHPKYYFFHGEEKICWIGSANLTRSGFSRNDELVHEFEITGMADLEWFEDLWKSLEPDPLPAIQEYDARYTKPNPAPKSASPRNYAHLPSLADIDTWGQFVEGLRVYDEFYRNSEFGFDVLGESHSWLHTINSGHKIVLRKNWTGLTPRECNILRGITLKTDDEGKWDLLGPAPWRGLYVFNPASDLADVEPIRIQIHEQISRILQVDSDEITNVGNDALKTIMQLPGFGPAAATRWLALARPDYMVSVNGPSAPGLGKALGLPKNQNPDGLANRYVDLLSRLRDRRWFKEFNGRQPVKPLDRAIWSCRAALVDVFVYEHKANRGTVIS